MALNAVCRLNSAQADLRPDMPRRQKKDTDSTGSNDALTLLRLQQQVLTLTTAKTALEDVQRLVQGTALHNFTSAQDRRTLSTAQSCLDSLRIRIEAQVNTVEEAVKQRQVSLALHQRQETAKAPVFLAELVTKRKPYAPFQTSTRSPTTSVRRDSEPTPICQVPSPHFLRVISNYPSSTQPMNSPLRSGYNPMQW